MPDFDKKKPADRFMSSVLKLFPTGPENLQRTYQDRNYTTPQLVEKNYKQKQKEISADTRALVTLGAGMTEAERRGYKRVATTNMLKERGVAERPLTTTEKLASIGDGFNIFSRKK